MFISILYPERIFNIGTNYVLYIELLQSSSISIHNLAHIFTEFLRFQDIKSITCFPLIICQVPYCTAVVNETLRLYTPILLNHRMNQEQGFYLGKYYVPPRTLLIMPPRAIHLNERYYARPFEFHPERFLVFNQRFYTVAAFYGRGNFHAFMLYSLVIHLHSNLLMNPVYVAGMYYSKGYRIM